MTRLDKADMFKGKRMLVVDDEPMLAYDVADILSDRGAEVVGPFLSLEDAESARTAEEGLIDAAVLDIQIGPKMVWPLAEQLERRGTPYVFVSAYCVSNQLPDAFHHRPCLGKPVDPAALEAALMDLLDRPPNQR